MPDVFLFSKANWNKVYTRRRFNLFLEDVLDLNK